VLISKQNFVLFFESIWNYAVLISNIESLIVPSKPMTTNIPRLMVFSKHLAGYPLKEVAQRLQSFNIQEIDLTVRPGGHVEPEKVQDELPRAAEELAAHSVAIGMISTNITDATHPITEKVIATAAQLQIKHYKLGYWLYNEFGTLRQLRDQARAQLRDLSQLNAQYGLTAGFHNHSDCFLGANLGDIDYVIAETSPETLGLYFDPCHAVIEGGSRGWEMGLDLLSHRVVMLAVKDFHWIPAGAGYAGSRRYSVQFAPLLDGNVPWLKVLHHLNQIGFDGPISLHSEYQGPHSFQDLTTDEVFIQTAKDAHLFRQWLTEINRP
jgi:sugar phosphate isomerase/epimerase